MPWNMLSGETVQSPSLGFKKKKYPLDIALNNLFKALKFALL